MKKFIIFSVAPAFLVFIIIIVMVFSAAAQTSNSEEILVSINLSDDVKSYEETVSIYCSDYDIEDYVVYILAIMMVESEGGGNDVMGIGDLNITPEESINKGCKIFSDNLKKAQKLGCNTDSVVQAYNYGSDFLDYVSKNGKNYTFELAEKYANVKSDGKIETYNNKIAESYGGWKYIYGNMFYVLLVKQYISTAVGSDLATYALQFVGEGHERFTTYESKNSLAFGADWCAMFVCYCADNLGYIDDGTLFWFNGCTTAFNRMLVEDTFEYSIAYCGSYVPKSGDLIFFTDNGGSSSYHVGIVTGINGQWISTVEGNTGSSSISPYWMGSSVCYKEDHYDMASSGILGYFPLSEKIKSR